MNPLSQIKGQRATLDWPLDDNLSVTFQFVLVTPEIAMDWLKLNRKNRRVKEKTVTAYSLDIRNSAWMLTHQGVAFDADGNLLDGQHRLMAVLKANKAVMMLVIWGWPTGEKRKTMDAVDRGVQRSLKDQLELQHSISDAAQVVKLTNGIVAASLVLERVFKSTTDSTLLVFELYKAEIKWILDNPVRTHSLKQATVLACIAMGRAAWPEKTAEFYRRLVTGENLGSNSPILHLRNYLLGKGSLERPAVIRLPITYHLQAFAEGKSLSSLVIHSDAGLMKLLSLQNGRVAKIREIYDQPELKREPRSKPAGEDEAASTNNVHPISADGIKIGESLSRRFTHTDLRARLDDRSDPGLFLAHWRNKGWIEHAGVGEFQKTEKFGK